MHFLNVAGQERCRTGQDSGGLVVLWSSALRLHPAASQTRLPVQTLLSLAPLLESLLTARAHTVEDKGTWAESQRL